MILNRLVIPIGVLLVGAVVWVACVDIPSDASTTINPDFRSLARFVNLAPGVAAANVTVDGAALGASLSFEGATAYSDVASGTRGIGFGGTTANVVFGSEEQSTIAIYATGGAVGYLNLREGRMDKNNGMPGVALVRFINIAEGSAEDFLFRSDSVTAPDLVETSYLSASGYTELTPGSRQIFGVSRADYGANLGGSQEVPPVTSLSSGVGSFLFSGDALEYNIVVQLSSSHGLFTAAHFHQEAAGTNGQVVHPIDVSGQEISFADAALSGDNEPTPVTTSASGTGTFTLTEEGLAFEVTVVADTLDTLFTAAHFHNAAAGANGPVVRTIATGVPFGDATFTGTWSSSDSEPLTPALVSELLAGNIYVNFHTASNPGGEIRAQVIPDSLTENTFAGTWSDAAVTTSASGTGTFTLTEEGLAFEVTVVADTLDTLFTAAHFHNAAAGANGPVVRTIATGVPFGDATFTGTWSSSDSEPLTPALVSELLAGNIYVNFHTASNPGGEIRAQVISDPLTENIFAGTWSDAALDPLRDVLNNDSIYVNFHTSGNPGGEIRGQVILASGSAGVASLPAFTYEDGGMYTILATGAGSTLQLTQLTDRQHGLSKPASGNPQLRAKAEAEQTDKTVQK